MERNQKLADQYRRYLKNDLSEEELDAFLNSLRSPENEAFVSSMMDGTWKEMFDQGEQTSINGTGVRQGRMIRYLAAASVIIVLVLAAVLLVTKTPEQPQVVQQEQGPTQDIQPGGDRATLTLADGTKILLDSVVDGSLAQQGGIKVIKVGGQVAYTGQESTTEVLYNTITTPKGGQYQLVLADGSKVWLNAASSLRFPTSFQGADRRVELTGEGYFEVNTKYEVRNTKKTPFLVNANGVVTEVLGTHFNVNTYDDEPEKKITLLEGSVRVSLGGESVVMKPGEQVRVASDKRLRITDKVDLEEAVAWKDGRFMFNSADIEAIMRQVARWYNVQVVYEKKTSETISGGLPRSENVSQLLKVLEATGKVTFDINGNEIIVKPK